MRKISGDGTICTVAGTGTRGGNSEGGDAIDAELNWPMGLAFDASGDLLITEVSSGRVLMIAP